jgi:hypothetical protein
MPIFVNTGLILSALTATPAVSEPQRYEATFRISGIIPVRCSAAVTSVERHAGSLRVHVSEDCNTPYRLVVRVMDTAGTGEDRSLTLQRRAFTRGSVIDLPYEASAAPLVQLYAEV